MQLAIGGLHRVAGNPERVGQRTRRRQWPAHVDRALEDQLAQGALDACVQRQAGMRRVDQPGLYRFELGMTEQLAGIKL